MQIDSCLLFPADYADTQNQSSGTRDMTSPACRTLTGMGHNRDNNEERY
jgi:hypothetical protein